MMKHFKDFFITLFVSSMITTFSNGAIDKLKEAALYAESLERDFLFRVLVFLVCALLITFAWYFLVSLSLVFTRDDFWKDKSKSSDSPQFPLNKPAKGA